MTGSFDVDRFYCDLLHAIGEHALRGGTAFGAAAVIKRVAKGYGPEVADRVGLPRPTRAEREVLAPGSGSRRADEPAPQGLPGRS